MVCIGAFQGNTPSFPIPTVQKTYSHIHTCTARTYQRISKLDDMVELNLGTLVQSNGIKARSVSAMMQSRRPPTPEEPMITAEHEQFFDSYSEMPQGDRENFFDAESDESDPIWDLLQLSDICRPSAFVDCVRLSDAELLRQEQQPSLNGPSITQRGLSDQAAISILSTDPHALLSVAGSKQAVIFDTGASLGITFDKDDFDGSLTIPEGDLRLGGMAQRLKIEGIGSVT